MPRRAFTNIDLKKGQVRGLRKSPFAFLDPKKHDESGELCNEKIVGRFKGLITVENDDEVRDYELTKHVKITEMWMHLNSVFKKVFGKQIPCSAPGELAKCPEIQERVFDAMRQANIDTTMIQEFATQQKYNLLIREELQRRIKCVGQIYLLESFDLSSRDIDSASDPYLKVTIGNQKYNLRDKYQLDTCSPTFNERFEFNVEFPGAPDVVIEVWDYDDLFGDDLIGKTTIDLDDRYYSSDW